MDPLDQLAHDVCRSIDSGGVENALDFFATEVVLQDLQALPEQAREGHDSLREHFARFTNQFDDFNVRVEDVRSSGSKVMLELRIGGKGMSGATSWGTLHHVYTVNRSEIVRVEVFRDRPAAAEAAGLA